IYGEIKFKIIRNQTQSYSAVKNCRGSGVAVVYQARIAVGINPSPNIGACIYSCYPAICKGRLQLRFKSTFSDYKLLTEQTSIFTSAIIVVVEHIITGPIQGKTEKIFTFPGIIEKEQPSEESEVQLAIVQK